MIIKSLIKDESKLTLDCAKATLQRGSKIEIDDKHWKSSEVQGAIRLGMIEIVGFPPSVPDSLVPNAPEKSIKYRNVYSSKLAFDCIKASVGIGEIIEIPLSMLDHVEMRNAIGSGWLLDIENPASYIPRTSSAALQLEEISADEILEDEIAVKSTVPPARPAPAPARAPVTAEGVPLTRPKPKGGAPKAKRISLAGGGGEDGVEEGQDELFVSSEVRVPADKPLLRNMPAPMEVSGNERSDEEITFADIFGKEQ